MKLASKASAPSFASACASLRLIESRAVAADDDAELVLCHGSLYLLVTNEYQGYIGDHGENARRHTARYQVTCMCPRTAGR